MVGHRSAVAGWMCAAFALLLLVAYVTAAHGVFALPFGSSQSIGVRLALKIDGLSVLFGTLVCGIGAMIFVYAGAYLHDRRDAVRAIVFLTLFMLAMLGVTTSENLIALFVFWELTSITSWLLIGLDHERQAARDAALQALLVTGGGGMAMMAGFLMLGSVAGTFDLTGIAAQGDAIRAHALYVPILLLILLGAVTKSAQVPFHFWLPSAMEAPTPVSAYLHSATMVKAGVFLIARLLTTLGGTPEWITILTILGAATMLTGAVLAVISHDLKRILAYTTMSALGTLVLLLGIGTTAAVQAAIVFLVAHAMYKAALFLVAGIVDHEAGTRDVERLGGLRGVMPRTATAAVLGAMSLASFGPVLSFAAKEMITESIAGSGTYAMPLKVIVYVTGALLAAAAALVALRPFFAKPPEPLQAHDPSPAMWAPPLLLAATGVAFALFPRFVTDLLLAPAAGAVRPDAADLRVVLWHGPDTPLLLAALAFAVGIVLYVTRTAWLGALAPLAPIGRIGPATIYRLLIRGMLRFAEMQTRILQSGYLRIYILIMLVTLVGLSVLAVSATSPLRLSMTLTDVRLHEAVIAALIVVGSLTAVTATSRLASVAALGVVGYSVALIYILFSAPDLAMTQFLIETLTIIVFILVIYRLPRYAKLTKPAARARDVIISAAAGAVVTVLVIAAVNEPVEPLLGGFYAANAVENAHGRNIVNVILVDFRGLDTLGEISVLAVAAMGVFALLRLRWRGGDV